MATTTSDGLTREIGVHSGINLKQKVGELEPEEIWQTHTNEVGGNESRLRLIRVPKLVEIGLLWHSSSAIEGHLTKAYAVKTNFTH